MAPRAKTFAFFWDDQDALQDASLASAEDLPELRLAAKASKAEPRRGGRCGRGIGAFGSASRRGRACGSSAPGLKSGGNNARLHRSGLLRGSSPPNAASYPLILFYFSPLPFFSKGSSHFSHFHGRSALTREDTVVLHSSSSPALWGSVGSCSPRCAMLPAESSLAPPRFLEIHVLVSGGSPAAARVGKPQRSGQKLQQGFRSSNPPGKTTHNPSYSPGLR